LLSIHLNNIGKKFRREWIFRHLNYEIQAGQKLVILGGNGSGKSTLLQIISGFVAANEGTLTYKLSENTIAPEQLHYQISLASPYLQVIEDFTLLEMAEHALCFKPFLNQLSAKEFIECIQLTNASNKYLREFSSGMKQRVKLGLAILSDTPLLLLDEPLSNIDKNGIAWYKGMIENYAALRTVIVCSNAISEEYFFCDTQLNVMEYKK
jgi:ABC-type multidrug transport system ATPase subunit